jgi:putative FmdB family regulatory protein
MRVPTQEVGVPTYQYACTESACGHRFEAVQSFSDDPLGICPVCDGQLRKVFSAVGVVFKGSGFYRTDSRTPERSSSGSADGKDGSSGKKSESSPASSSSSSSDSGSSTSSSESPAKTPSGSSSGSTSRAAAS